MMPTTIETERQALLDDLRALAATGELLVEDFAVIDARYKRLFRAGHPFAAEFVLLMQLLSMQARHTDDDPDSDQGVDDGQEDDSDNHGFGGGSSFDWMIDEVPGPQMPYMVDSGSSAEYWARHLPDGVQPVSCDHDPVDGGAR